MVALRWRPDGGQAILTLRVQSERFDHAWNLLSDTYREVIVPNGGISSQTRCVIDQFQTFTQMVVAIAGGFR